MELKVGRVIIVLFFVKSIACQEIADLNSNYQVTLNPFYSYLSADDVNRWLFACNANVTADGVAFVVDAPDNVGTMRTKARLNPATDMDFQFEVHVTATDRDKGDGFAIYITPETSIDNETCKATAKNCSYGLTLPYVPALGLRVYGWWKIISVNMMPNGTAKSFSWPWVHTEGEPAKYNIGTCVPFHEIYFENLTIAVRFLDGNLTVDMVSVLSANSSVLHWRCADNVPAPGLVEVINKGDAVIAVTGGVGTQIYYNNPVLQSFKFFAIKELPPTTTAATTTINVETTTRAETATPSLTTVVEQTNRSTGISDEFEDLEFFKTYHWPYIVRDPDFELSTFFPNLTTWESSVPKWTIAKLIEECRDISPRMIAPPNNGEATPSRVAFIIDRLVDFDNVGETITVSAVMYIRWKVTTCTLNQNEEALSRVNREHIFIPSPDNAWTPSYLFTSAANDIFMKGRGFGRDMQGTIKASPNWLFKTLDFYYIRRGFYKAVCELDLTKFPFDTQTCYYDFSLQVSSLQFYFSNFLILCPEEDSTEWAFFACNFTWGEVKFEGQVVSSAYFESTLTRKPLYYIVNLVLPNLFLELLSISCFLISADRVERPIFAVTVLLALTVAQAHIIEGVPKTADRILLVDYTLMLTCCAGLGTLYHLFACLLANNITSAADLFDLLHRDSFGEEIPLRNGGNNKRPSTGRICGRKFDRARFGDAVMLITIVLLTIAIHIYAIVVAFY